MGIFGNKNKLKKLNPRGVYTIGEVKRMIQDERFAHYEFLPIDSDDIQSGYKPVLREELRSYMDKIKKSRRDEEFVAYVNGNGIYKNIDREGNRNLYNDYQSAKSYQSKEFGTR